MYFKLMLSGWKEMTRFWLRNFQRGSRRMRDWKIWDVTPCRWISSAWRFERKRCVPAVPQGSERSGQRGGRTVRRPAYGGKCPAFCGKSEAKARVLRTSAGATQGQYDGWVALCIEWWQWVIHFTVLKDRWQHQSMGSQRVSGDRPSATLCPWLSPRSIVRMTQHVGTHWWRVGTAMGDRTNGCDDTNRHEHPKPSAI